MIDRGEAVVATIKNYVPSSTRLFSRSSHAHLDVNLKLKVDGSKSGQKSAMRSGPQPLAFRYSAA